MRVGLVGINVVLPDSFTYPGCGNFAIVSQRLERGDDNEITVDFKVRPKLVAIVGTPVTIGTQYMIAPTRWYECANLVCEGLHVVGGCHDGSGRVFQHARDVGLGCIGIFWMQQLMALTVQTIASQLGETGSTPDIGADVPVVTQHVLCRHDLTQDGASADE